MNQKQGKKPYADVTIKTMATDTFYLEKHDDKDFMYWLKSTDTLEEARKTLIRCFTGCRRQPEVDARYYIDRMIDFKNFLEKNRYQDNDVFH